MDKYEIERAIQRIASDLESGEHGVLERISLAAETESALEKWLGPLLPYLLTKYIDLAHQTEGLSALQIAQLTGVPVVRVEQCLRSVSDA